MFKKFKTLPINHKLKSWEKRVKYIKNLGHIRKNSCSNIVYDI